MHLLHPSRSLFVAFEGIDASGKATQSRRLATAMNRSMLYTFPEYDTPTGKLIRSHLRKEWGASPCSVDVPPEVKSRPANALVFQALMLANRMEFAVGMESHLNNGGNIVADRYAISGIAYGGSDGLPEDYLENLHAHLPQPHYYFLLDIPVEESFRRRPDRGGDRYEEDRPKLEDVRQRYLDFFRRKASGNSPTTWVIVDAARSADEIHEEIVSRLKADGW